MKRALEILAFLLIVAMVICGVVVVDAAADKLEQRDHFADTSNVVIEETNFVIDQLQDVAIPFEDPQESEKIEAALDWHYIEACELTAYCPCSACCGEWALNRPNGIVYTASGAEAQADLTIAVDPDVIPIGSWVEIDGEMYRAEDVGGGVIGNHIDIYFADHDEAWDFGRQYADVRWYPGL